MNHSPEPWRLEDSGFLSSHKCVDADGRFIAGWSSDEGDISCDDPNWERIVACVNACKGFSTDNLKQFECVMDGWISGVRSLAAKYPKGLPEMSPRLKQAIDDAVNSFREMEDAQGLYCLIERIEQAASPTTDWCDELLDA